MEHSLHVTHIKIKRSQLYLTIQLPRPDIKIQAELFYQNSSQNFRHQLRCVSKNPQNLIFQIDVSVLEPGENDWNLRLYSDDCPDSWMPVIGSRLRMQLILGSYSVKKTHVCFSRWGVPGIVLSCGAVHCGHTTVLFFILKNSPLLVLEN